MSELSEADYEALDDVLYAKWPEDTFERLKFLEREVERIVAAHVARATTDAEARLARALDLIAAERNEAVRINRDMDREFTRTRRDAAEHFAGGLAEATRIIRAALDPAPTTDAER